MNIQLVLSLPPDIQVQETQVDETGVHVTAIATQPSPPCPLCGTPSFRVHRRTTRTLHGLPCSGHPVHLTVHIRKCFCDEPNCPRKIFAERLLPLADVRARVTRPGIRLVQMVGLATGGRPGQRLLNQLSLPTSRSTILRRIMALPALPHPPVTQVGIDDFAFRRGHVYGTLLVDLQTHAVIDLLPDREVATVAAWLRHHPDIRLISRDRGGDYAAAARLALPHAIQVADRFHLMQNFVAVIEGVLARCRAEMRASAVALEHMTPSAPRFPTQWTSLDDWRQAVPVTGEHAKHQHRLQRRDQYEQVIRYHQQGATTDEIAHRMKMHSKTIGRWLQEGFVPERKQYVRRSSRFDPYAAYVLRRWEEGCHTGTCLYDEIVALGFTGSPRLVYRFLVPLRHAERSVRVPIPSYPLQNLAARHLVWLFIRDPTSLTADEQATLARVGESSSTATTMYALAQGFRHLIHRQEGASFEEWCEQVSQSTIQELHRFVRNLKRDEAAVRAAFTEATNNGQVEGHVHKLKLLKRMMFGRATFPLLRQRVLHASP